MKLFAHTNGTRYELDLEIHRDRLIVRLNGRELAVTLDEQQASIRTAFLGDRRLDFGWDRRDGRYFILIDGVDYEIEIRDTKGELMARMAKESGVARGAANVRAPIPGLITRILLKEGDTVKKGQPVMCLDAMKLENEIASPMDGTLQSISVKAGQPVEKGQALFIVV